MKKIFFALIISSSFNSILANESFPMPGNNVQEIPNFPITKQELSVKNNNINAEIDPEEEIKLNEQTKQELKVFKENLLQLRKKREELYETLSDEAKEFLKKRSSKWQQRK